MNRALRRLLPVTILLLTMLATPAHAADELALSRDGQSWTSSIDAPLFDESMRWVPGDTESAQFFVRNQGGTPGDLTVDVISSRAGRLMDSGDLHITAKGGGGTWSSVSKGGTHRLLSSPDIADGAVVPITVTVAFDADSTSITQLRSTSFTLRVTLSESARTGGGDGDGNGLLPDTGAPATWIAGLGALLVGVGLAFVARRRARKEADAHV